MSLKQTSKKNIVICLAGMTACGKSTVAKRLAEKYRIEYISGGTILKELAFQMGYKIQSIGWWETIEGIRFLEQRLQDPRFDKKVDAELLNWAQRGNVVLDSWTMAWLSDVGFKIWLEVTPQERARRLASRDRVNLREAEKVIKEKDGKTKQIYEKIYGFKLGEDFSPFDLILDTEKLNSKKVFDVLSLVVNCLVLGK
jgi:cytidylate kinase